MVKIKERGILIVDDEPLKIENLMVILEWGDYSNLYSADNGEEAIELSGSSENAINLILLDVRMPGVDGYETCRKLKNLEKTKNIPIIFVTGKAQEEEDFLKGFDVGGADYISTPINKGELLVRVRNQLELYILHNELEKKVNIEFPPEYQEAGMGILNFFGTVLKEKYPEKEVTVRIEQRGSKVTMIIEPKEGEKEVIEKELKNFGLVITGKMKLEEYTDNSILAMQFENKLAIAKVEIENQKRILDFQNKELEHKNRELEGKTRIIEKIIDKEPSIEKLLAMVAGGITPKNIDSPSRKKGNFFILKGDLKGYGNHMDKGKSLEISDSFKEVVNKQANDLIYSDVSGGDSLSLVHDEPLLLVKSALRILEDLGEIPEFPKLRMAVDFGSLVFEEKDEKFGKPVDGLVLKSSARIEPFVAPGEVWVTEKVKVMLKEKAEVYQCVEITPEALGEERKGMEYREGKWDISKESEKESWIKLYRVERKSS